MIVSCDTDPQACLTQLTYSTLVGVVHCCVKPGSQYGWTAVRSMTGRQSVNIKVHQHIVNALTLRY